MKRILFVCHGNICRSPMAEFVMKDIVHSHGRARDYHIESAAVSGEEEGNPVYPPVRQLLGSLGISCGGKRARRIYADDYYDFDLIVAMDRSNLRYLERILPSADVADPWYTGDFETCYRDIMLGCRSLFDALEKSGSGAW